MSATGLCGVRVFAPDISACLAEYGIFYWDYRLDEDTDGTPMLRVLLEMPPSEAGFDLHYVTDETSLDLARSNAPAAIIADRLYELDVLPFGGGLVGRTLDLDAPIGGPVYDPEPPFAYDPEANLPF